MAGTGKRHPAEPESRCRKEAQRMAEHSETVARIAREIMKIAEYEGWTGAAGGGSAIDAAMGALAAVTVTHGERHSLALDLTQFAEGVAIWGLAYVQQQADPAHRWAKQATEGKGCVDEGYFDHDWYD